jgi:hypothetical protein
MRVLRSKGSDPKPLQGAQVTGRNKPQLVEVEPSGVRWAKSSASGVSGSTSCVEVALAGNVVLVRTSRHRTGPRLVFPASSWDFFLAG